MKLAEKIRCTYSDLFAIEMSRSKWAGKERFGFVLNPAQWGECWNVLWDNSKTPATIHKSYITLLNSEQKDKRSVATEVDSSNVAGQQTEAGNKTI